MEQNIKMGIMERQDKLTVLFWCEACGGVVITDNYEVVTKGLCCKCLEEKKERYSLINLAEDLYGSTRNFTKEEAERYKKSINKIFKKKEDIKGLCCKCEEEKRRLKGSLWQERARQGLEERKKYLANLDQTPKK